MPIINFKFADSATPDDKKALLIAIKQMDGVEQAALLKPDSKIPALQKMAYARVDEPAVPQLLEELQHMSTISQACLSATRYSQASP